MCPRFIGREEELVLVLARFREATEGRGSVVLIGGEAVIGKSRLLTVARTMLAEHGAWVAMAQCWRNAQSPLGPFAEILHALDASDPAVLGAQTELRRRLAGLVGAVPESALPENQDRGLQYVAVTEVLRRFGAAQPTVLCIEDVQWADLASIELVQYLAERVESSRLLVLATYRVDEVVAQHPLALAITKLQRAPRSVTLRLPALSRVEMQALIAHALQGRAPPGPARVNEVITRSEGNPLFAEELLRYVIEAGDRDEAAGGLPLSVRAAVLERAAALSPAVRTTLAYAAAIGRRFDVPLLSRLVASGGEDVAAHLRAARDLQLILEEPDAFVFRHALVQEALYAELLESEARLLHERLLRDLEVRASGDDDVIALAYHAWEARDAERSTRYNEAAGNIATRRLAHADAARFYERAIAFVRDDAHRAALEAKLARALVASGSGAAARRAFERSLAYYESIGDNATIAELLLDVGRLESDPDVALGWRRRTLEATEALPNHPLRFAALIEMACQSMHPR